MNWNNTTRHAIGTTILCLAALTTTAASAAAQQMVSVKGSTLNMRSGPGTQHSFVGKVEYGEVLRTREKRADWVRVERDSGKMGWIARRLLWGW